MIPALTIAAAFLLTQDTAPAPAAPAAPAIIRVTRPADAVAMALADAQALAADAPHVAATCRYIAVPEADETTRAGISYAVNTAMLHSAEPRRAFPVGNGDVFRVNLAELADYDEKRTRLLLDTWDRMTDETYYLPTDQLKEVACARYFHAGTNRVWDRISVKVVIPAAHADIDGQLTALCKLTGAAVPIISAGQFMRFSMNSEPPGLYPDFRGLDKSPERGTAEQAFLARAGVNLNELGERNADQRVVLFRNPTGQPGAIEFMPAAITRPSVGPTIATITRDYFSGPIQAGKHPLENLADRKHDGTEIFVPTAAGGLEYGLFDANGGFVASAPPNLAADRTIPAPWLPILQGPSGCIRCHVRQNAETKRLAIYQPAPNLVTTLREVRVGDYQFDVFGDVKDKNADKGLARLVSLYNGETDEAFSYAGRTFAKYSFEASGLPMEEAVEAMLKIHDDWLYSFVEPTKAMLMLGFKTPNNESAVELFNQVCPPAQEPLRVTQLRAWKQGNAVKIPIDDWLAVFAEVALRVMLWEQSQSGADSIIPTEDIDQ